MLDCFYPDEYVESAYQIDFDALSQKGIRGVLFDIDNTLVPHGEPADERALALFARLRQMGLATCLISNNKEPRVKPFAKAVGSLYIFDGHKPSVKNYKKAMEMMGTDAKSTVFVGDQIFTDTYGAKRAGLYTILTKPIHPREEIQIVLKRYLERIVLHFYLKKKREES